MDVSITDHLTCVILKEDTQCTCNVKLRSVRETIVAIETSMYYILLCVRAWVWAYVCVCVLVGVAARARVCGRARVDLVIQYATRMRHIASSLAPPYFSTLSHQRHDFRKKSY